MFDNLKWAEIQALEEKGVDVSALILRAERIERNWAPDGATEYVPLTEGYAATKFLGRHTLRRLGITIS